MKRIYKAIENANKVYEGEVIFEYLPNYPYCKTKQYAVQYIVVREDGIQVAIGLEVFNTVKDFTTWIEGSPAL